MVRNYIKKTDGEKIPMEIIEKACAEILSGRLTIRKVARKYGLNNSTLCRYYRKKLSGESLKAIETDALKSRKYLPDPKTNGNILSGTFSPSQLKNDQRSQISNEQYSIQMSQQLPIEANIKKSSSSKFDSSETHKKNAPKDVLLQQQEALDRCASILSQIQPKDTHTIFGEHVANELRHISIHPDIVSKAKCDIQEILIKASCESISRQYLAAPAGQVNETATVAPQLSSQTFASASDQNDIVNSGQREMKTEHSEITVEPQEIKIEYEEIATEPDILSHFTP